MLLQCDIECHIEYDIQYIYDIACAGYCYLRTPFSETKIKYKI